MRILIARAVHYTQQIGVERHRVVNFLPWANLVEVGAAPIGMWSTTRGHKALIEKMVKDFDNAE